MANDTELNGTEIGQIKDIKEKFKKENNYENYDYDLNEDSFELTDKKEKTSEFYTKIIKEFEEIKKEIKEQSKWKKYFKDENKHNNYIDIVINSSYVPNIGEEWLKEGYGEKSEEIIAFKSFLNNQIRNRIEKINNYNNSENNYKTERENIKANWREAKQKITKLQKKINKIEETSRVNSDNIEVFLTKINSSNFYQPWYKNWYKDSKNEYNKAKYVYCNDKSNLKFFSDVDENPDSDYILLTSMNEITDEYKAELSGDTCFINDKKEKFCIVAKSIGRDDLLSKDKIYLYSIILERKTTDKIKNEIYLIWKCKEEEKRTTYYVSSIKLPQNANWAFKEQNLKKIDTYIYKDFEKKPADLFGKSDRGEKKLGKIIREVEKKECFFLRLNEEYAPKDLSNIAITYKYMADLSEGKPLDATKINSEDYFVDFSIRNKKTGNIYASDEISKEKITELIYLEHPKGGTNETINISTFSEELGDLRDSFTLGYLSTSIPNANNVNYPDILAIRNNKGKFNVLTCYNTSGANNVSIKDTEVNPGDEIALAIVSLGDDVDLKPDSLRIINNFNTSINKAAKDSQSLVDGRLRINKNENEILKEDGKIRIEEGGRIEYGFKNADATKKLENGKTIINYFLENYNDYFEATGDTLSWQHYKNAIYVNKKFCDEEEAKINELVVALDSSDKIKDLESNFRSFLYDIITTIHKENKKYRPNDDNFILETPFEKLKDEYIEEIAKTYFKTKTDEERKSLKEKVISTSKNKDEFTKEDIEKIIERKIKEEQVNIEQNKNNLYANEFYVAVKITARKKIKLLKVGDNLSNIPGKITALAYYIPQNNTEISDDNSGDVAQYNEMEKFIQTWSLKFSDKEEKNIKQTIIPVNNYYDTLSGMHPYIEASFRCSVSNTLEGEYFKIDGKPFLQRIKVDNTISYAKLTEDKNGIFEISVKDEIKKYKKEPVTSEEATQILSAKYHTINSLRHPFFKSLSVVDKGFKTFTLVLFDKDFGSYNKDLEKENMYYSIDSLIRGALVSPMSGINNSSEYSYLNEAETTEVGNEYLRFNSDLPASTANIKLRWGYIDSNEKRLKSTQTNVNSETGTQISQGRDFRWWDVRKLGDDDASRQVILSKGIGTNGKIETNRVVKTSSVDTTPRNSLDTDVSFNKHIESLEPTTSMSREYEFMITGFKTALKDNGIEYTISGIEAKDGQLLSTRFLQRYSEINASPVETLFMLEHVFNEDNSGNNITTSPVKIVLQEDSGSKKGTELMINQEYDFNMLDKSHWGQIKEKTTYGNILNGNGSITVPKALKNITVSFGGNDAQRNYSATNSPISQPLYKSVASLMDEFCASCPPKEINSVAEKKAFDSNGEEIASETKSSSSRPLKWYSFKDEATDIIYIVLYYRNIKPQKVIRKYTWGPNNPNLSCVTSLNIENKNEFAVLSGVKSFNGKDMKTKFNDNVNYKEIKGKSEYSLQHGINEVANIAGANKDAYDRAFSNCMYSGKMTILGDPFFAFDRDLQPYTYAISLDVLLPMNERMARREFPSDLLKFGNKRTFGEGNQLVHESSGYYVISEINHEISSSGYTTTLDIVSYPNIEDEVIKGEVDTKMLDASLRTF